jgi:hypothetical protein
MLYETHLSFIKEHASEVDFVKKAAYTADYMLVYVLYRDKRGVQIIKHFTRVSGSENEAENIVNYELIFY